ncbi:MAG: ABC transporter ATP-binding protein, partial [Haemophilus parainfluenzae]|nr:ABC transporter ATP-binding protein [Haemophilus parainfluenzae]
MNVLEVKQLQIMRDQRVIIDNLSFELPEGH